MEKISIIVPCYNEEDNIEPLYNECVETFKNYNYEIELIFVNDGSKDNTLEQLKSIVKRKELKTMVINFSRNFGKEAAIYAGLEHSEGDYTVIIDADLQQHPKLIKNMIKQIEDDDSIDCVCYYQEKRIEGKITTLLKKTFYKIINKISDVEFVSGASDFRLLRKYVVDAILKLGEKNRFSKGIFSWVGFKTKYIPYTPSVRKNGKSSFGLKSSFKYAMSGIVSFSTAPLRISIWLGMFFSVISLTYLIVVVIQKIFFTIDIPGYATIVASILLIGGIILFTLGIIGQYISKIYVETKNRPIYIKKELIVNKK